MERKKTFTMNWEGLADQDDEDRFYETLERISCATPLDLASSCSDEDDDDFEDSRMSFASTVPSMHPDRFRNFPNSSSTPMSPDYNVWMMAPGSINERRKRLFQDMGLSKNKELVSFKRIVSNKQQVPPQVPVKKGNVEEAKPDQASCSPVRPQRTTSPSPSPLRIRIVRSRSDGDIESVSVDKRRKEEMIGRISKQRLTRTSSMVLAPNAPIRPYQESVRVANKEGGRGGNIQPNGSLTSILSNNRLGAFFLIRNLDTGKEFIVNEYNEQGMWNRLSDLQTGKQLTMEEFEKSVGYSPVVKELMRRENVSSHGRSKSLSANSYLSKSLRMSKRRGAALLKNIKGVANSMTSLKIDQKEKEENPPAATEEKEKEKDKEKQQQKQGKNTSSNNKWVKVRQTGKSNKEFSALHLCQEIQAHEGSIWTIKFSSDARFLASAGEDRTINVWEVQECEVMSMSEGSLTPLHPSVCASPDHKSGNLEGSSFNPEKKKKGKGSSPDYVHVPETVFSLSEKPVCSFNGHLDDVLDLSWSKSQLLLSSSMDKTVRLWDMETKSCLKLFAHNDYVTCIQFNPVDDNSFISGSLDAKVRIWSIPYRLVIDWTDLHEMVTAACYTPDGQNALIGSHKGNCRMYKIEDSKLVQVNQVDFQTKKKSNTRKITGFQFSPCNPSEVLVTSADSRIRILNGLDLVHKFRGFRNTSSQISASFSLDGRYVVCASEDSNVYVWKREEHRHVDKAKKTFVNTRAHEHFQCKDVSVAITWPGVVKGEPPPLLVNSKRHSKRLGTQPPPTNESPTKEESPAQSKRMLPPLPKKNNKTDRVPTLPEEDLAQVSRDPGIGEAVDSNSSSMRYGDSPSISGADSNASSTRHDDPSSITASVGPNSSSMRNGDSSFPSWSSSWSWFDNGTSKDASHTVQATAWGLVIVTATLGGEIRIYQNFGIPRRLGRL